MATQRSATIILKQNTSGKELKITVNQSAASAAVFTFTSSGSTTLTSDITWNAGVGSNTTIATQTITSTKVYAESTTNPNWTITTDTALQPYITPSKSGNTIVFTKKTDNKTTADVTGKVTLKQAESDKTIVYTVTIKVVPTVVFTAAINPVTIAYNNLDAVTNAITSTIGGSSTDWSITSVAPEWLTVIKSGTSLSIKAKSKNS